MSEPAAAPAPTLANFDAIISSKLASADAAGDGDSGSDASEANELPPARAERKREEEAPEEPAFGEPDEGEEEPEPLAAEAEESVEPEIRAPFKALREAKKAGYVTPELMKAIGDLPLPVQMPDGSVAEFRLDELPKHIMRESRFHRELAKTKEDQQRAQNIVEIERARSHAWATQRGALRQGLQSMGLEQAVDAMFWEMVQEQHQYWSASPQQRQQYDQMKRIEAERRQERAQFLEVQRQLEAAKKQQPQQMDHVTQQAYRHLETNMDPMLQAAFKAKGVGGKITDDERGTFLQTFMTLCDKHGYAAPDAMQEAAGIVADRFAEIRERSRAARAREEQQKPRELSGRRAPAGPAQTRDADSGRFTQRPNGSKKGKPPPTAAEFARRMGI